MRHVTQVTASLLISLVVLPGCANPAAPTPVTPAPVATEAPTPTESPDGELALAPEGANISTAAARVQPRYFAVAASGGFNRNNVAQPASGTSYAGVLNEALSRCQRAGGGMCEHIAICGPLSPSRPWVSVYRSSVYSPSYLDRGATGVACGHASAGSAQNYARTACGLHPCRNLITAPVF
jgi:hypothetical protein